MSFVGTDPAPPPSAGSVHTLTRSRTRWFPLRPLMEAAGLATMSAVRSRFPMNGAAYRQVLDRGLTEEQADRWAVKLGLLPAEVWPEWLDDLEVECAAVDCSVRFVPVQAHQRYCGSTCSSRQRRRDRYKADPTYRRQRKAEAARYYEANGEAVRERNREAKRDARQRAAERRGAAA